MSPGCKGRGKLLGISATIAENNMVSGWTVRMSSPGDVRPPTVYCSRIPCIGVEMGLSSIMHSVSPLATVEPEGRRCRTDKLSWLKYMYGCGDVRSFIPRVIRVSDFMLDSVTVSTASTAIIVMVPYRR